MNIGRMNGDWWETVCILVPTYFGRCIGAGMGEIIPHGERLERLGEGCAVIDKDIVKISHLSITTIGSISVKLSDDIVSEPFSHIQCPDNGSVFVVADAAFK